jgi:hypothetical protein
MADANAGPILAAWNRPPQEAALLFDVGRWTFDVGRSARENVCTRDTC